MSRWNVGDLALARQAEKGWVYVHIEDAETLGIRYGIDGWTYVTVV